MDDKRQMLRHFLAALAYRTQKALRGAPDDFGNFRAHSGIRTPHELVFHMTNVIGYGRTLFVGGEFRPTILPSLEAEITRFHKALEEFAVHLDHGSEFVGTTPRKMLQGPFSDAMTHAGQLAMLRRLHGKAVPPENFIVADVDTLNLGPNQPDPVSPDDDWTEPE